MTRDFEDFEDFEEVEIGFIKTAIAKLEKQKIEWGFLDNFDVNENYTTTIALKKQVPQKMEYDGKGKWTCPRCSTLLYHSEEFKHCLNDIFIYCSECGQRLEQEM